MSTDVVKEVSDKLGIPPERLFMVSRTTSWDSKPCDNARQCEYTYIDRRWVNDPAKVPAHKGDSKWWYGEGTNHRIESGKIVRDRGTTESWFTEISDLMEFVRYHKEPCIFSIDEDGFQEVEIYDGYRE